MRFSNYYVYLLFALAGLLLLASCSDSGGDKPDPDPTKYTKTFNPQDTKTNETLSDAVTYNDESGTKLGTGRFSLKREEGTKLTLRTEADGYKPKQTKLVFSETGTVSIELTKKPPTHPDNVSVEYDVKDGQADSLVAPSGNLTFGGKAIDGTAGQASGSFSLPYSRDSGKLCATADYFRQAGNCTQLTPEKDQTVHLTLTRTSVSVAVNVSAKDGGDVDPEVQVEAGFGQTYTYSAGETSHSFGARSGNRAVSVSADGYNPKDKTIAADADQTLAVELTAKEKQPACSDGKDNDGDGKIDADDSGCVDSQQSTSHVPGTDGFVYQKDDDNEVLKYAVSSSASGTNYEFVSSKEGEREYGIFGRNFPASIAFAVGEVNISLENKIEKSQTGEAFALKIACGPESENRLDHDNPNTTDIVPDDPSVDGWRTSAIHGMTREWVTDGTDCAIYAVHATKVLGEYPGDGKDDVIFSTDTYSSSRSFKWYYEQEEVDAHQ